MSELRLDFGRLGKAERTPQGGVRVPAFVTRIGVLSYKRADGSIVRELRHPDEVFHPDSLVTLEDAPVTNLHPPTLVTPNTYKNVSVGHVRGKAERKDGYVASRLVVQDADTVTGINSGALKEISCGYTCKIDATPGTFEGKAYDQIQRKIRYNHVALGPANWGRAGNDVSLRLDGAAVQLNDAPSAPKTRDTMKTIRIDGVDYEVGSDAHLQAQTKMDDKRAEELRCMTAERDNLQGRMDEQEKELTEAKDPARLDALVSDRLAVIETARPVLGEDTRFDGKSNVEIMREALVKADPEIKLDGRSEDYIAGRFEAMPVPVTEERTDATTKARVATTPVKGTTKLEEYRKLVLSARENYADDDWTVEKVLAL